MAYAASSMSPVVNRSRFPNPTASKTTPIIAQEPVHLRNPSDPYAPIRAQVEKPIKLIENVFGKDIRVDPKNIDQDVAASFKRESFGRDRMLTGSLPYATPPRLKREPLQRMVPMDTRVPRGEWNEALARAGPFYYRHWQIWDYAPYVPSNGDVTLDPRYTSNPIRTSMTTLKTRGL